MPPIVYIYITNSSQEDAGRVARHLLEQRLIGCANMIPIASMYWWEGKIEEGAEVVLIAKTTPDRYDAVKREVEKVHPYSVPCIVRLPAEANDGYYQWLLENLGQSEPGA